VKPPAAPISAPIAKPIIPGGPVAAAPRSGLASLPPKPVVVATPIAAARPTPVAAPSQPALVRSVSKPNGAVKYDAENPPPPSTEFMKWCREALTGLSVPSSFPHFARSLNQ
jgi:hypothetical protein